MMPLKVWKEFVVEFMFVSIVSMTIICQGGVVEMKDLEVNLGFDQVPVVYTCDGRDISPKIDIRGLNATSFALIVDDPDAPSGTFTHWVIWNIEPIDSIPAEIPGDDVLTEPIKGVQGLNSAGTVGYIGPCPPSGKPHRYYFKVYGLDSALNLEPGATKSDLENAMSGHIIQMGEAMATYGR